MSIAVYVFGCAVFFHVTFACLFVSGVTSNDLLQVCGSTFSALYYDFVNQNLQINQCQSNDNL